MGPACGICKLDTGPAGHAADCVARAGLDLSKSKSDSLCVPACPGPSLAEVVSFVSWAALGLLSRSEWFRFVWNVQALA